MLVTMSEYDDTTPATDRPARLDGGRIWSLRTVAAAAITAVALSGAGGAALAAASDGTSTGGGMGPRGSFGGPPGTVTPQQGQQPPVAGGP